MAGEALLLSGDQIASYSNANVTFPGGLTNIQLQGLTTLGDSTSRFFLVRETGTGDLVTNGQFFGVYPAIDDGSGNLVPGPAPVISATYATPDAYNNTGAGDDYIIFGMFGGSKYAVNLSGFGGASTATFVQGSDVAPGGDGELSLTEIDAANPDGGVICFERGTLIETPEGHVPVETLQAGDNVCVLGGKPKPIRWIGSQTVRLTSGGSEPAPVRILQDAFGRGLPFRDLVVSPNHRLSYDSAMADLLFASPSILVPAKFLVNGRTALRELDRTTVEYWHFLFDSHEIVRSNGLLAESLHPGEIAIGSMAGASRAEILDIFPDLANLASPARRLKAPCLRQYEARLLAYLDDLR